MKYNKIVVTGGSGMVGKSLKKYLTDAIFLSSKDYDLTVEDEVDNMFFDLRPDVVIHLSAKVGGIMDNINKPYEYFTQNVLMNTLLVDRSILYGVKRFIGILSTCAYPDMVDSYPMTESQLHIGPPSPTNLSYGYAKRAMAVQIDACNAQFGLKYQYLLPCNLYGENDNFSESGHFVASLLRKIIDLKNTGSKKLTLFGSGSPLRQFMYSDDLANVIYTCLTNEIYENMNVATKENLTIRQIAEMALNVLGLNDVEIVFDTSKPDGQYRKDVSVDLLYKHIPEFNPVSFEKGIKLVYDKIS